VPVQIEEDIDDGWFTTIDKQQWVGSVFKREKIHEDDDATDEIIAKYVSLCKHRIREFNGSCQVLKISSITTSSRKATNDGRETVSTSRIYGDIGTLSNMAKPRRKSHGQTVIGQ
jgi:hypothetical protein